TPCGSPNTFCSRDRSRGFPCRRGMTQAMWFQAWGLFPCFAVVARKTFAPMMEKQKSSFVSSFVVLNIIIVVLCILAPAARSAPLEEWHWRNPLPQGNALNRVVFVNGVYVAVGELGTILTSSDGTNWVTQTSGTIAELRGCAYGGGQYVVVGELGTV